MKMIYLKADDVWLVVDDLVTTKISLIRDTKSYTIFGPPLAEKHDVLAHLYKGSQTRPLAASLKETDVIHDTNGRAVHLLSLALEAVDALPAATRDFLVKVRETFVPNLSDLMKSYEDEAALAKRRSAELEAMKPELEAFSIGSISLYTLVSAYLDAGNRLDTLLSSRADTVADEEAKRIKDIFVLRSQALGLLNQFRAALAQEVAFDKSLPRDLETKVFAYMDQIAETRAARAASHAAAAPETVDTEGAASPPSA